MNRKIKKRIVIVLATMGIILASTAVGWVIYQNIMIDRLRDLAISAYRDIENAACVPEEFSEHPEDMSAEDIERTKDYVTEVIESYVMSGTRGYEAINSFYRDNVVEIYIRERYRKMEVDYRETFYAKIYWDTAEICLLVGDTSWTVFPATKVYIDQLTVTFRRTEDGWKIVELKQEPWDVEDK